MIPHKIYDFFEGHFRMFKGRYRFLKPFIKEQVLYRSEICKNTCAVKGECQYCGCSIPGKWYASRSCNKGELFPDMMDKSKWVKWKKDNNIIINIK
tara:strand:+ start:2290 stop:2577 length:288 start_codon:yes stop_codon:yes gene_type:complete